MGKIESREKIKKAIINLLHQPEYIDLLMRNKLDEVFDKIRHDVDYHDYCKNCYVSPMETAINIFKEANIDILAYMNTLKRRDYYLIQGDLSKYTNIKHVEETADPYGVHNQTLILPNSIISIGKGAFYSCIFKQFKSRSAYLQLYTDSLKQVGEDALSNIEGIVIIDTEKFDSSDPEFNVKIQDYLKSKGIPYSYT